MPELLAETSGKYPKLNFELTEISAIDLDRALLNYKVDIGFNRDRPTNEQLSFKLLNEDNFGLFVPKNHWLPSNKSIKLKDVSEEKFILPSLTNGSQYAEELKDIFKAHHFIPQPFIESDYGATILNLIAKGLGISVMPASYAHNLPKAVRFIALPYKTRLYAVWRKQDGSEVLKNLLALFKNAAANRE